MKKYNCMKEKYLIPGLFFIFFLFQFIQIFQFKFYVQADDFAYVANSAYFAGYNWNPYVGNMTPFYNIGFSIFGAWAFWLFDNPASIYQGLLMVILVFQILLMYLIYRIVYEYLEVDKRSAAVIALLYSMTTMAPQCGLDFMSEVPFALCFVFAIFMMLKCREAEGKKKMLYSGILGLATAYSYAVHTRFLVLIGVVFLTVLLYHICTKKKMISYVAFILTFAIGFFLVSQWMGYVQGTLYKTTIDGRIIDGNDALTRLGYIGEFIRVFTDWEYIKRFLRNILSLAAVYTLLTGGMVWIAGIGMLSKTLEIFKRKEYTRTDKVYLILTLAGFVSFVGMNILTAINGAINTNEYKWLTYHRYAKPFVGVVFVAGLVYLWKKKMSKGEIIFSYLGILGSLYCSLHFTTQMLRDAGHADVSAVGWMYYYFYNGQAPTEYFPKFAGIALVVSFVYLACILKKKQKLAFLLYLVYSIILTGSEVYCNVRISEENYSMVDKTYAFVKEYEDQLEVPIYFMQAGYSGRLRFALYDTKLHYVLTEEEYKEIDFKNAIVLSDKDFRRDWSMVRKNRLKYSVKLDEFEYVFTSNPDIYEMIKGEGIQ